MANENKEIGDIVKKCKILLLDIEGTTTSISFVKDKLFPYAEENVKQFLESQWESDEVKEAVGALRKLALEDKEKSVEGHVAIPEEDASKEDQIEGLVNNVKWQMSSDRKAGPLKQLQGLIWKQGYDKGDIKGHVYDDVSSALEQWHSVDGQKVYIYSSGSVQAQKLLFGQSLAGDLLKFIEGHFDTGVGAKQESASYTAIVEKIGSKADDILFLTDIVKEAEAARSAGLNVVLVSREGNAPLPTEATDSFAVIHSLGQLTISNKRKTDPQDELPAKVPKTDISNDVKTTVQTETPAVQQETSIKEKENEPEKMEVEEDPTPLKETAKEPNKVKEDNVDIPQVIAEKVTDSKDSDTPVVEVEPVLTESKETNGDQQEVEKMETEITENVKESEAADIEKKVESEKVETETKVESGKLETEKSVETGDKSESTKKTETPEITNVPKVEVKENASIADAPPVVITEIEDITDKENSPEMAEVIEGLEPVVEEPTGSEDIELQNVGEVLEKECDEILSKVQDVTNLDNIPLKPLLNPITEESMETDNVDSNDIMDRILDKEQELETKQTENNPKSEAPEDAKTEKVNEKIEEVVEKTDKAVEVSDKVAEIAETDKDAENSVKAAENINKVENTDTLTEEPVAVSETTEMPEKMEIPEKENSIEPTSDNNVSSLNENKDTMEVKETEQKIEKELPPESIKESSPLEEQTKAETVKTTEDTKKEENTETPLEQKTEEKALVDTKINEVTEEQKPEESTTGESQVNGEATNGEKDSLNQNGDASKDEELSSRLSVENGKEVNGSNGDSMDVENGGDKKVEADVADIKVKTVTTEEPHSELIEQPTEA